MKIGTKVKIKKESEYYGQSLSVGEIYKYNTEADEDDHNLDYVYCVRFKDGYYNAYRDMDLVRINNKAKELNI